MANLTLSLMSEDEDILLELAMEVPDTDVDLFRSHLEDYFVGMAMTKSKPNLYPTDVEVIDSYDPTPYCHICGAMSMVHCDCGPRAEND